jgi:DNA repair protein RecO (recombination protein O)
MPGPHRGFSASLGGTVCTDCRPQGTSLTSTAAVEHLAALLAGDWGTASLTPDHAAADASRLVTSYVHWHLERRVRSLTVLERT